jgi:curved DNA-binding protein
MEFKDYYKILGVERTADQKTISQAFRRLAAQYHPDVNKSRGAEERFKEINEAYQVLHDPEKRARYDQIYDAYQRGGVPWEQVFRGAYQQAPGGYTVTFGDLGDLEDLLGGGFSEFFQQFFGGLGARSGRRRAGRGPSAVEEVRRGAEARPQASAELELTLEEAFRGVRKPVTLQVDGTTRRLDVTVPPGVRDGQRLRLGGALDGGDLYLTIRIRPHPVFTRQGDDLLVEVPVSLPDALLGAEVDVPTLEGPVRMQIPPETQNGRTFRLRGLGMPKAGGGRGDQLVRVRVVLPERLTEEERRFFEEMRRRRAGGGRARAVGKV